MGGSVSVPRKRVEPAAKYSPQYILKGNTEVAPTSSREKIGECGLAAQLEYAEQLSQQQEDQHSSCQNFDILDSKPILLMGGKRTWPHNDNPRGFQQFQFLKVIGSGAYSVVCSAVCRHSGQKVAIKRIANIFSRERDLTKTFLREAMILNHCNHPNVLKLRGLFTQGTDFDQVHFVTDLMDTDLHRVLRSNIILSVNVCITCSIL